MRRHLSERLAANLCRLGLRPAPHMKELEIYGAVALGGLVFLVIVIRLLFQ